MTENDVREFCANLKQDLLECVAKGQEVTINGTLGDGKIVLSLSLDESAPVPEVKEAGA